MKTEYKYIRMELVDDTGKTTKWDVKNKKNNITLGNIKWYGPWRRYCYFPTVLATYSKGCLKDIIDFIDQLTEERENGNN